MLRSLFFFVCGTKLLIQGCYDGLACHTVRLFGAGDRDQVLHGSGSEKSFQEGKVMKQAIETLRQKPVLQRAARNLEIQTLPNRETNRFKEPLLGYLRQLFPSLADVESQAAWRTHFFPVFFEYNRALCVAHVDDKAPPEISREPSMFVSLLAMLALECVINSHLAERSVLVICYLNRVVADLEAFLERYLPRMCAVWHEKLFQTREKFNYDYGKLKSTIDLRVVGPINARGKTADIVFVVAMQRQALDEDYAGNMADGNLLQIHLTRVRRRLYVFLHDLTEGIRMGDGKDDLARKATAAGVPESKRIKTKGASTQDLRRVHNSNLRRQLWFWELKKLAKTVWDKEYDLDFETAGSSTCTEADYFVDLRKTLPFQLSSPYGKLLTREMESIDRKFRPSDLFRTARWLDEPLHKAFTFYQEMDALPKAWPAPIKSEEVCRLGTMDDVAFWQEILHNDKQCQKALIVDNRRRQGANTFRTSAQRKDESDEENDPEPDPASLFEAWKCLMLYCPTISIDSDEKCCVCVPFVSLEDARVTNIYSKSGKPVKEVESAWWLARALAEATDQEFKELGVSFLCFGTTRQTPGLSRREVFFFQ